jgi:O-antigen ligase
LLALWQFYSPHGALTQLFSTVVREPRPMATLGHTNWFASYLLLLLPLALHQSLKPNPRAWPAVAALLFAATLVAQTRGAWIALAFLLPFALWNGRRHHQALLRLALLLVLVATALLPYDQGRILRRAASLDDEAETALTGSSNTGSGRFGFWKYAARLVPRHLALGSGLDTLPDHATAANPAPVDKAHSIYLEYAVTLGGLGTAAYLLCLGLCFTRPQPPQRWPWLALLGTYLIQGAFIHDTIQTWPLLWILAALAAINLGTSAPRSNSCGPQNQTSC